MMKKIISLILLLVSLYSCKGEEDYLYNPQLVTVDSLLISNPVKAASLFADIHPADFKEYDNAYYRLLSFAVRYRNGNHKLIDTSINNAKRYYSKNYKGGIGGFYLIRANLYEAINRFNINEKDTTVYDAFKLVQKELENAEYKNKEKISHYNALALTYLGKLNVRTSGFTLSDEYFEKAKYEFATIKDTLSMIYLVVEQTQSAVKQKLTQSIRSNLDTLDMLTQNIINNEIKYRITGLYADYYLHRKEYEKALHYAKLQLLRVDGSGIEHVNVFRNLAKIYTSINELDSAVLYTKKAVDIARGSSVESELLHSLYLDLGNLYSSKKLPSEAAASYKSAYYAAFNYSAYFHKHRQSLIEKKYDENMQYKNMEVSQSYKWIFILVFTTILLILLFFIRWLLYKVKLSKINRQHYESAQQNLEKELKNSKFLIDVISSSFGVLPNFIDKVNAMSSKLFSSDPKLYEAFQQEIDQVKGETKKRLLGIVNNENLASISPIIKYLDSLNSQEKMIVLLLEQKYSTKYIASILNISQAGIRVSKARIKAKVAEMDLTADIKENLMNLFN